MANGIELGKINRNLVYRALLNRDEMTKQEIASATGLSIPTVSMNLQRLQEEGLVTQTGALESTGGRRATGFRCVRNARFSVGIDITQNHITVALVNVASEIVCISERESFRFEDNEACYERIAGKVLSLIKREKIGEDRLLGVGVSLPCIVDREKNEVTYSKLLDAPKDVAGKLEEKLLYRVEAFNDANAAGYAEMCEMPVQDRDRRMLFYLMLSNSVGGAMIYESGIYAGDTSRSGEIGHMKIVPDGRECYCGQKGCVNAYCSARLLSDLTNGNLARFFEEMEEGNREFQAVFEEYLRYLAIAVVNLRLLYDCDIILGGYVGARLGRYMERLRSYVAELNPYQQDGDYLISCGFRLEASAVGAAMTFIGHFIEEL